jgi:hypothetical protein
MNIGRYIFFRSRDSSVGIATGYGLGSTQFAIQSLPGALSPGVKRRVREDDHPTVRSTVLRSRMVGLYLHCPICLHGRALD